MMTVIIIYLVVSICVGLKDVSRISKQEKYLDTYPQGDIGYYIEPKEIIGLHNKIFFPSYLVFAVVRWINR